MATKAWRGEEVRRSTTFEDLQDIVGCSTRIAILVTLSGGPMRVKDLVHWLGFRSQHVSNHLTILRALGMVDYDGEGVNHFYRLACQAPIVVVNGGLVINLRADDGSVLSGTIVKVAGIMRVLQRAVAASQAPRITAPADTKIVIVRQPTPEADSTASDGRHTAAS